MLLRTIFAILALGACEKPTTEPRPDLRVSAESAQCVRDDDCVLLPGALTCCIECPPTPPFEVAPSWVLDGMLVENDTDCAEPRHLCPSITCDPIPATCVASAACTAGRCVVVATGCELPTS